jgi:hypothetical protein
LTEPPSNSQLLVARAAVALLVTLVVLGVALHGLSTDELKRLWGDIVTRPGGPMTFRFILQPAMAAIAALRDGIKDARLGRRPYLLALLRGVRGPEGRRGRLWEGIISTGRILVLGVVMDLIYQLAFLQTFYPAESALIAILLAFLPYAFLRGPFERVARRWVAGPASA